MLVLVMSLLCWTQTEGSCSATIVSITGENEELSVGEAFNLTCEFKCLGTQHFAELQKKSGNKNVPLISVRSTHANVSLKLKICSATEADAGYYVCRTQPPEAISPSLHIKIAENLTTTKSTHSTESSLLPSSAGGRSRPCGPTSQNGLQGQIWYWMLLGKTAVLLLSLASLAVKYKRG